LLIVEIATPKGDSYYDSATHGAAPVPRQALAELPFRAVQHSHPVTIRSGVLYPQLALIER
jgi:hypothetical protein